MKDRAFFDAVVAPHLANKRVKQFMDRWLLGEDLAEYAAPGRLDELNALEQCLLAWRVPAAAPPGAPDGRLLRSASDAARGGGRRL